MRSPDILETHSLAFLNALPWTPMNENPSLSLSAGVGRFFYGVFFEWEVRLDLA